jgi:hypothetical protein
LSRFASRFCCGVLSAVFFVCFFESLVFDMGFPSLQFGPKTAECRPGPRGLSNRIAREEIAAKLRVEGNHVAFPRAARTNSPPVKGLTAFAPTRRWGRYFATRGRLGATVIAIRGDVGNTGGVP